VGEEIPVFADQFANKPGLHCNAALPASHARFFWEILSNINYVDHISGWRGRTRMQQCLDESRNHPRLRPQRAAPGVIPDDLLRLIRGSIKSVWTLDVLLLMRREGRSWPVDELARELRGNRTLVHDVLSALTKAGLVAADDDGTYRYRPASAEADAMVGRLERIYIERPLALIKEIVSAPNEKIQSFADAFRLKKD
jgi:hypothetical protein